MKRIALLIALLAPAPSWALSVPKAGEYDYRMKVVAYNPNDVVRLVAHDGYQLTVVFAPGEHVLKHGIYLGDPGAWAFATLDNYLSLKPRAKGGDTDMTVLTNRHHYTFLLRSRSSRRALRAKDMFFQVRFQYPREQQLAAGKARRDGKRKDRLRAALNRKKPPRNWDYWAQGSQALTPDQAYDDGTFTYFRYSGNRQVPAVYVVGADGTESLVNWNMAGDELVVHAIAPKFILRNGNAVAAVYNKGYDPVGLAHRSGTTVPGVSRIIKGGN